MGDLNYFHNFCQNKVCIAYYSIFLTNLDLHNQSSFLIHVALGMPVTSEN